MSYELRVMGYGLEGLAEALAGKLEEALPKNAQSHRDVVARPLQ